MDAKQDYDAVVECDVMRAAGHIIKTTGAVFEVVDCVPSPAGGFVAGCMVVTAKADAA